jgi:hypothetical protein
MDALNKGGRFSSIIRGKNHGSGYKKSFKTSSKGDVIKYYCSFSNTIADVLSARGWKEVDEHDNWDFVWGRY